MKSKTTKIIAIVLALVMLLSVVIAAITSLMADARVTQAEIDRLRQEHREYQRRIQEVQTEINAIDFEMRTETSKKQVLDDRIVLTGYQIENIIRIIDHYGILIEEMEEEVQNAIRQEEAQLDRYRRRVRNMEENGSIRYLEIIFNFRSFSDLLARIDMIGEIMRNDERLYHDLIDARNETIAARDRLEETRAGMEEERVLLGELQAQLLVQLDEAHAIIESLQANRDSEAALRREFEESATRIQQDINRQVAEFERQQAAERAAAAAAAARNQAAAVQITRVGTGQLVWPVPSSGNVTSPFGTRVHPLFGTIRQHRGIDIAANHGAAVVAADSGTVITSAFDSSYGHFVVIAHGNGRTTLYAHLSSRRVSRGDTVERGQTIGLIGSTGVSTGPHLHFEVSQNGSRVNPMHFFR
jgi:murein DD-endopeptidase MepM/ murein hydrolase activator NlpD